MSTFSIVFCGAGGVERFDGIVRFIGADDSGSFGIRPRHEAAIAVLRCGLARFQDTSGTWRYAALPGGVLRFAGDAMTIVAAHCFIGTERTLLAERLAADLARADSELRTMRDTLDGIDRTLIQRLSDLGQSRRESMR
jgi:F-type H+-transporting ATPase subunit epsilon